MFISIFKHAFHLLPIFKGAWIPRNACVSTTVFLEVFWDLRASLTASLSNPTSISSKTSISSHLHSDLMAGELGIEVGNLFSLWQDLDPWWPLDYCHNWLFNFSHCCSRALWAIHSPSQPPQNMVGMMFGAVFQEGRKKSSAFLWYRNSLPDQCPNQSYSIEEQRGVLYWCFMLWHERSSGLQIQF